jgi:hypothetical protein
MFTAHLIIARSEIEDGPTVKAFYEGNTARIAASDLATGSSVSVQHWIERFPNDITLAEAESYIQHRLDTGKGMPDTADMAEVQPA